MKQGASGTGTATWSNAFGNPQQAIAVAASFDEIRIAAGTYTAGTSISDSFVLPNEVRIRGGYSGLPGTENDPPAPNTYITVLSGDLGANGNSLIIVSSDGSADTTRLEGVTISEASQHAIKAVSSDAQFLNLRVTDNFADGDSGAAMFIDDSSLVTISESIFDFNTADLSGGAVFVDRFSRPSFQGCDFIENSSVGGFGGGGGAVFCNGGTVPRFDGCLFEDNSTGDFGEGGAIYYGGNDTGGDNHFEVRNSIFRRNSATGTDGVGGAIRLLGAANPSTWLVACTFFDNSAAIGGGAVCESSGNADLHLEVVNCSFLSNTTGRQGGGCFVNGRTTMMNSIFANNYAFNTTGNPGRGGAVYHQARSLTMTNCTVNANYSETANGGGGVYTLPAGTNGSLTIKNSILWDNTTGTLLSNESSQLAFLNTPPTITDSCVRLLGIFGGAGTGNIGLNPLFIDANGADNTIGTEDDDLRLQATSPCIDNGSNEVPSDTTNVDGINGTSEPTPDFELRKRIQKGSLQAEGGSCSAALADLGALEHARDDGSATGCTPNNVPDYLDVAGCPTCDTNADGLLDACQDCDQSGTPDPVQIATQPGLDCNGNCILDRCEIEVGSAPNGPYYCETGCNPDCNHNGVPDECELADGSVDDCNGNDVPDLCELLEVENDCNEDLALDECQIQQPIDHYSTHFIVTFLPMNEQLGTTNTKLQIHLLSRVTTQARVTYPIGSTNSNDTQIVTVTPGAVTVVNVNRFASASWLVGQADDNAVNVESDDPVACYMFSRHPKTSDASLVIPVSAWDNESIAITSIANSGFSTDQTEFVVVASMDNTNVAIKPSQTLSTGQVGDQTFNITLNAGEAFFARSAAVNGVLSDLTGSLFLGTNPIQVTSGNFCTLIPAGVLACDTLVEVVPPISNWGTHYALSDLPYRTSYGSFYRYIAFENSTTVTRNGLEVAALNKGQFFQELLKGSHVIVSDKPIAVAQFMTSSGTVGPDSQGDPDMVLLTPMNQYSKSHEFTTLLGAVSGC